MIIGHIEGATRTIGTTQNYRGMPVRDVVLNSALDGLDTPAMETAWLPTPAEIAAINAGAPVILRILGTVHPPVAVEVGKVPELVSFIGC